MVNFQSGNESKSESKQAKIKYSARRAKIEVVNDDRSRELPERRISRVTLSRETSVTIVTLRVHTLTLHLLNLKACYKVVN